MGGIDQGKTRLVGRLRAEQVQRWQHGERISVEDLITAEPDLLNTADGLLDLIYGELLLREEAGEHPTADEFTARFPSLANEIRRQFAIHTALPVDDEWQTNTQPASDFTDAKSSTTPGTIALPVVPGYELLSELGRGGMGVVYKARDRQLKRIIALKMLRDRSLADATVLARFRTEAEAVARLQHTNIVQIYDFGECDGCPYLSLEYVAGGSLEAWTQPPLHSVGDCATLVETVARAIGYAHQQQIVHRDLKPANILLQQLDGGRSNVEGDPSPARFTSDRPSLILHPSSFIPHPSSLIVPKITDFGLAKQLAGDSNLTQSEAILGTGAYMSPEQAWGQSRDAGPPTDVHALGVILYELLTGTTPFRDQSLMKTLDRVRFEEPRPPSRLRHEIPSPLDEICLRCLRKAPAERYATAEQLADDLRRFLNGESPPDSLIRRATRSRNQTRNLAIVAGALLLLVTGLIWGAIHRRQSSPTSRGTASPVPLSLPTPSRTRPEAFAFLVGVRSYEFAAERIELEFTESDVDELSRVLLRRGVPRRNIRLLTQWSEADNPDLAPTAANIRRQLRALLDACIPGDSVLVAITGIGGESGTAGTYCYLPSDARLDDAPSLMSLSEFFDLFRACRAEKKILLVDTCQTAALRDFHFPESPVPPGVAALFACSGHEASYEHPNLRHGVFSYHILRGLEGAADANHDGLIAIGELYTFARQGVQEFLRENVPDAVQTPALVSSLADTAAVFPAVR
jgi:serine/threonine protein kinase